MSESKADFKQTAEDAHVQTMFAAAVLKARERIIELDDCVEQARERSVLKVLGQSSEAKLAGGAPVVSGRSE